MSTAANELVIRPQPKQEKFLSSPADIVIYGGAAGSGKSFALLMEPLRHIKNGKFGAVIFRRSYPEITREGGMWDNALDIYPMTGGISNKTELQYTFSSGMKITFSHIQDIKALETWRGAQIPLIEFDQLETFLRYQFFYMLSRNRSMCGVRPYVRATCNPQPGWLADFMSWWIADDGYADLSRSGKIRWMVVNDQTVTWADTRQELIDKFGPESKPLSVTFIAATIYDNPRLLERDPDYLARLKALPLVDRERLLGDAQRGGNWKIKPEAGKVFNRAWFKIVKAIPSGGLVVRRWDFAATEASVGNDPDYTASVLMTLIGGNIYIMDATNERIDPPKIVSLLKNRSDQDRTRLKAQGRHYIVRWEQEGGSSGKITSYNFTTLMAGYDARGVSSTGDKITRAMPLAAQAEAGNVYVLEGAWNEAYLEHMHNQPASHDDMMDASSGAYYDLLHNANTWTRTTR